MKGVLKLWWVVLFLAAIAGGYWYYQNKLAPASAASAASGASGTFTQVVQVKQGSLSSTVSVVGQLEAVQSEDLAFEKMSGTAKLKSLAVKAGNTVKAGDVLAAIEGASYQQALDQAKSDLQAAEKKLADLQTPATALEMAQADLAIAKAQYQVEEAKQALADLQAPELDTLKSAVQTAQDNLAILAFNEALAEHDSAAKSERNLQYNVNWYERRIADLQVLVDQHKANLEQTKELADRQTTLADFRADLARVQAERQLAIKAREAEKAKDTIALADAQKALADAQAGGDKLALAKAQLDVQDAQVSVQAAQQARADVTAGAAASDLASAQADADKKRLAVADAEAALAGTQLKASFDGTVLKTNVAAGDLIGSSTSILTVANLKTLQVAASIDETTIKRVEAGQTAQITFDAYAGQTFTGKVQSVPLEGALQGGVTVYEVPLSLEGAEKLPLLVGMTANVKVQVAQVQNALLIPAMALEKVNGQYQVLVASSDPQGQPVSVPVEIGLSDGTNTQITKGLNVGDRVVVQLSTSAGTTNNRLGGGGGFSVEFVGPPGGGPVR